MDEASDTQPQRASNATDEVVQDADDLIDAIDEVLRASLGLGADASDDEFEERARAEVASYVQKGGQ